MPYVPGFDNDLFISYASLDNDGGAVVEFVETLEKHLADNLVSFAAKEKVRIYFDRKRLGGETAVDWAQELEDAASSCALLVPLLSPNYLSSKICATELAWFGSQPHARESPPAVVGWRKVPAGAELPAELGRAQRHPPGDSWLADLSPAERKASAQAFALKVRDALERKRASVSAVFLGPASAGTAATKSYVRDELEKAGYRVVPGPDYLYGDEEKIRELLKSALLAVHFVGDGNTEGIPVMAEALQALPDEKTVLIQPAGVKLSTDEEDFLKENDVRRHHYLTGKTNPQVWEFIQREVKVARFRAHPERESVGVACHELDLEGAQSVAGLLHKTTGVATHWPRYDTARGTAEKLKAFKQTFTDSDSLLCYWAKAEERQMHARLKPAFVRKYKARGWYLAPPLDMPGKNVPLDGVVMRQEREDADVATLIEFLDQLGWRPEKT